MLHCNADYRSTIFAGFADVISLLQILHGLSGKECFSLTMQVSGLQIDSIGCRTLSLKQSTRTRKPNPH